MPNAVHNPHPGLKSRSFRGETGYMLLVLMFFVGELAISRVLYILRIRDQPY